MAANPPPRMNAFQGAPAQYKPSTDPNSMQRYPANDPTSLTTQERQRRIHEEIAMMRGAQAKMMTFQAAWNLLKQQKPELFNFGNEDATVQLTPAKAVTARASTIHAERPSDEVTVQGGFFSNILTGEVVPLRLHL